MKIKKELNYEWCCRLQVKKYIPWNVDQTAASALYNARTKLLLIQRKTWARLQILHREIYVLGYKLSTVKYMNKPAAWSTVKYMDRKAPDFDV